MTSHLLLPLTFAFAFNNYSIPFATRQARPFTQHSRGLAYTFTRQVLLKQVQSPDLLSPSCSKDISSWLPGRASPLHGLMAQFRYNLDDSDDENEGFDDEIEVQHYGEWRLTARL